MSKLKIYTAMRMTNRYQDELVAEARMLKRALENWGYEILNPVIEENVPNKHELLEQVDEERLKKYWQRDKECLQQCHIVLDFMSCNRSDGVGVELALSRFAYWKPTLRVFPNAGFCISRLEYDDVFDNLLDALVFMMTHYGSKSKLLKWRLNMLRRSLPKFIGLQIRFLGDLLW